MPAAIPATNTASAPILGSASPRARRTVLVVALLALGIALLAWLWDWNWFKGPIERRVEAATGRQFEIQGNLDVDPGWRRASVRADRIRLGNAAWSKQPQMFEADAIEIDINWWPLLRGDLVLAAARLEKPRLLLERDATHAGNWWFDTPARPGRQIEIGQLLVDDGTLTVRDAPSRTDLDIALESLPPGESDALAPLSVSGKGRYRGFDFKLDGRVESPLGLRNRTERYWVDLAARAGPTRVTARGRLRGMAKLQQFDLHMTLRGPDLALLDRLFGIVMPPTPPYTLGGRLYRRGDEWEYRDLKGKVGDSDIAGAVTITFGGERPHLKAALVSDRLDFDDLAGFIGAPPSADAGETASATQKRDAAALAANPRVLPQQPYDLDKLRRMDADVTLRAAKVDASPLPIESLEGRLVIDAGVAKLDPFSMAFAGGQVDSRITLDASKAPITSSADLTLRGLQLPKLFPQAELTEDSAGRIGGRIALAGSGNSVAKMLATSNGEVGLVMGRGRISNLLLELAGLDVAEALRFLLGKDRIVPIRCAHADFAVKDGVVTSRSFVFDTTDTILFGEGTVDLRDESLDLVLRPKPKDRSLVSLRSPLKVDGNFKDPDIHPQAGPLALRSLAAAALYALAPPAALLALIETGPGEDSDCTVKTEKSKKTQG